MTADPAAMELAGIEVGEPQERFAWARVRHHAPDVEWPPKGASLRLDFEPSPNSRRAFHDLPPSATGRDELISDTFDTLDDAWRIHATDALASASFINEGKPGEIVALQNTAVYAERDLPAGARLVEVRIDPGTDRSASWGPGIALVWPDYTLKLNYRPGMVATGKPDHFGVWCPDAEGLVTSPSDTITPDAPVWLRIRLDGAEANCEVSTDGQRWSHLEGVTLPDDTGGPVSLRVGKLSRTGAADDFSVLGEPVRLKVLSVAAFGEMNDAAAAELAARMDRLAGLTVSVHYEMYDAVPLLAKWITVSNGTDEPVRVESFTSEILAAVEYESTVERGSNAALPNMHVEADMEFHGDCPANANEVVHWVPDPDYTTQVNYQLQAPVLLECRPKLGPDVTIAPGDEFESFRTYELIYDSTQRERNGLALRRMYRTVAPWATENPIIMHSRNSDPESVKLCIDQCAEVGFEMVIMTFWSGFDMENTDPAYLAEIKGLVDYAHERGVELGGYSLLASRSAGPEHDVVDPETGRTDRAFFGHSPCLESEWGQDYFRKLTTFIEETGLDLLEHDGSYPGDVCASTKHPGHDGLGDSQWRQWVRIRDFYHWCRARGAYLNVPDWYFLSGSSKSAMGYRETNWSLPREWQVIHGRQNIYDGTWEKTPSMGWMFVPLVQYQGGGAAATLEPLAEHLDAYGAHLAQNFGSGVQACYRGPRLFDTDETKAVVAKWVEFFKRHRDILESDIIHLRRPDARGIDGILHVNPSLPTKGLAMLYNSLAEPVSETVTLPLYYTGLTKIARIREQDGPSRKYRLDRDHSVDVRVEIPPESATWLIIE